MTDEVAGKITDADIERARRQIGVPQASRAMPFNPVSASTTMSHFAFGVIGDDNPLWHDESYGGSSRWRGQIAHPMYPMTMGANETPAPDAEQKALFKGLFRGVGKYHSGIRWEWFRPIYAGETLYEDYATAAIDVKDRSNFTGTRTVLDTYRSLYVSRSADPVCLREDLFVNAERAASKKAGKHDAFERQTYSEEDIAAIDARYAAEERRGSEPRFWEDVEVGDVLVPVVKGPLTVTDIISQHVGFGFSKMYAIGPARYGWKLRTKMPAFYSKDLYGVPDVMMRVHWDDARARELGLPTTYDYGLMRNGWLIHLVTNWMGDDAWLWSMDCKMRAFNFLGDTTICSGSITAKHIVDGHCIVDLDLAATNQRGEVTTPGSARVILPSREHGAIVLPRPSQEYVTRAAAMMASSAIAQTL